MDEDFVNSLIFDVKESKMKKRTSKNKNKTKKKSIFFKAKHPKLVKIISIKSLRDASNSVKKIKKMANRGHSSFSKKQLRGALILAGVRARALANKKNIGRRERKKLKEIAEIYLKGAKDLHTHKKREVKNNMARKTSKKKKKTSKRKKIKVR